MSLVLFPQHACEVGRFFSDEVTHLRDEVTQPGSLVAGWTRAPRPPGPQTGVLPLCRAPGGDDVWSGQRDCQARGMRGGRGLADVILRAQNLLAARQLVLLPPKPSQ